MRSLALVAADQLSTPQLVEAFNHTFEGYSLPITQTVESLSAMIEADDIQLQASLVARAPDGEYAAIGLLAVRGVRGWVGGMATAPSWRRQGVGARLLQRLLTRADSLGLDTVELEVLEDNTAAHKLYQQAGFNDVRLLSVFRGPLAAGSKTTPMGKSEDEMPAPVILEVESRMVLQDFERFHQVPAAWQRQSAALIHLAPRLQGLALSTTAGLQAYVLTMPTPQGYMVMDFGSQDQSYLHRVQHAERLLNHLVAGSPNSAVQVINVPPGDALGDALNHLGCQVLLRQWEMVVPRK
jgi:ribosomal protein S18 acetylase RimI-like enzyme